MRYAAGSACWMDWMWTIRIQRFLGYDYVRQAADDIKLPLRGRIAEDTAEEQRAGGRIFVEQGKGPITTWEEFEQYPWPDPSELTYSALEWYEEHLPDDMCVVGGGWFGQFAELPTWLMGFESLCYALHDQRDLVRAICHRLILARMLEFDRVKIIWAADDMGFKTGPLIAPDEDAVRSRVRETLDVCLPGGGYCLGTGNSMANYIPLANYLAMLDEGRRYAGS